MNVRLLPGPRIHVFRSTVSSLQLPTVLKFCVTVLSTKLVLKWYIIFEGIGEHSMVKLMENL